jgi:hypothetical protein
MTGASRIWAGHMIIEVVTHVQLDISALLSIKQQMSTSHTLEIHKYRHTTFALGLFPKHLRLLTLKHAQREPG